MDFAQAFEELDLEPDASPAEIRKAHKAMARERHPDHDGDLQSMQRLNEAKEIALRHSGEMEAASSQEVVLRQMLDIERRRDERDIDREKGRELVAATATIQIGRLRQTQRRASTVAVLAAALTAATAAWKGFVSSPSPLVDIYLVAFGIAAIGFGLYRTLLAERIGRIQFAIDDVSSTLMYRSTFANVFRDIAEGLLDMNEFDDGDLESASRLWLSPVFEKPGNWVDDAMVCTTGIADDVFVESAYRDEPLVALRDILRRSRIDGLGNRPVGRIFASWVERGTLRGHCSDRGICFSREELLRHAEAIDVQHEAFRGTDARPSSWSMIWVSVRFSNPGARNPEPRNVGPVRALIRLYRRFVRVRENDSVDEKIKALARMVGVIDLTKLIIGKGLENHLLTETETVDRNGNLMTTYRFSLDAGRRSEDG